MVHNLLTTLLNFELLPTAKTYPEIKTNKSLKDLTEVRLSKIQTNSTLCFHSNRFLKKQS